LEPFEGGGRLVEPGAQLTRPPPRET